MTMQGIGAIVGTWLGGALYDVGIFLPVIACAAAVSLGALLSPIAVPEDEAESETSRSET
jgi:hypothetical protein